MYNPDQSQVVMAGSAERAQMLAAVPDSVCQSCWHAPVVQRLRMAEIGTKLPCDEVSADVCF